MTASQAGIFLSISAFGMVAAGAALAQEQPAAQALDKVEITGSRVPLTMHELPESISEITRADIQRLGPATGVDLFRHVPGLQIDQLGGPGGLSSVYIRGSDPNHVLVLVDGVRVNDSTNSRGGGFDMSSLDPSSIERIEVLRGAASSIYGAEAMGGVINIVTRNGLDATGLQAGGGAGIGGQDFRSANARMSAGAPNMRMSVNASKLKDGNDIEGGELDFSQVGAAAKWRIDPTAFLNLELRHNERKSSSFPDDSGGIELAKLRTLERKQSSETSLGIRGRRALDASTLNFAATTYRHIEDIVSPGVAPGVRSAVGVPSSVSGTDYRRSNATANGVVHLGGEDQLAVGVEYQRERGANRTSYTFFGRLIPVDFELTRNTRSAFSELKWQPLQDLTVRAGLHYDDVGGVGSRTSPSAGARYNLPAIDGGFKASYGAGFKPPSFFALGLPVALGGNPNLRAEKSRGGSIGYDQNLFGSGVAAAISVFKTRYTDLVTFNNETNQTVNADKVDIHGAEFETRLQLTSALLLQSNFTRLVSHIADSNEPLRQRPGKRAGVRLAWTPIEVATLTWRTEYSALSFDSSVPTGNVTLPTYLRSDAGLTWRWQKSWNVSAALDNVFDKRNENYVGAIAPGRRFRVSLSAVL